MKGHGRAELNQVDAGRLARVLLQKEPLGKAHMTLVRWILDAMDATKQVLPRP